MVPTAFSDCATGYGDLVADALGLHMRHNGLNLLAVALFALAGFAVLIIMVEVKGRHTSILGGLGRQSSALSQAHGTTTGATDRTAKESCDDKGCGFDP